MGWNKNGMQMTLGRESKSFKQEKVSNILMVYPEIPA